MINRNEARMGLRFLRLMSWRVIKRKWYLPNVPEITTKELFGRLNSKTPPFLLDLRDKEHYEGNGQDKYDRDGHIKGAKWIPMMKLSSRYDEIPKDREIITMCPGGGMSLVGVELLKKEGFKDVKSLKGGVWEWVKNGYPLVRSTISEDDDSSSEDIKPIVVQDRSTVVDGEQPLSEKYLGEIYKTVDARGWLCPKPILESRKTLKEMKINQVLEIITTDPGSKTDIPAFVHVTGQELLISEEQGTHEFRFLVRKLK